jgi:hypothetical protein
MRRRRCSSNTSSHADCWHERCEGRVGRTTAYAHQKADVAFAEQWEHALEQGADVLEREARRRAVEGVQEPVFHQGSHGGRHGQAARTDDSWELVEPLSCDRAFTS